MIGVCARGGGDRGRHRRRPAGLIAAVFGLFVFGYACEGTDVAAPPSEGTVGDALCGSRVYAWDAVLWLVVAGCRSQRSRCR